jgi:hypothetical protein
MFYNLFVNTHNLTLFILILDRPSTKFCIPSYWINVVISDYFRFVLSVPKLLIK